MIKSLTDEQLEQIAIYRDKWIKIGLSCEPLDFERAKSVVAKIYKKAGLVHPKKYFRFPSPFSAAAGTSILVAPIRDQIREQIREQIYFQVDDQMVDQIYHPIMDQIKDQIGTPVWEQIGRNVWSQVSQQAETQFIAQANVQLESQFWDQTGDGPWAQFEDQAGDQVRTGTYGCHDAHRLGIYDYFLNVLSLDCCQPLAGLLELAECCGWWAPYKHMAILQDRPQSISFDENQLLHHEKEMAIQYRDGFGVYAWHGTRVPADWIEKEPPLENILHWENIEQRRAGCEILGWDKILSILEVKSINRHHNSEIGELLETHLPNSGVERFLKVKCGTGRTFVIPVPPDVETALQANAWTYGLNTNQFKIEVRT